MHVLLGLDSYSFRLAFGGRADIRPDHPLDVFRLLDRVEEYGLDGVQIDPMHLRACDDRTLAALREHAEERDLFIEAGTMALTAAELERGIHVSTLLGATTLRTFLGFNRFSPDTDIRSELERAQAIITAGGDALRRAGITLAIENHGDLRSGELTGLVHDLRNPRVGICLDTGNTLCVMEDPLQAVERMIPYAVSTHFKDCVIEGTDAGCMISGTALGSGVLPLREIYRVIRGLGTLNKLILEVPIHAAYGDIGALEREEEAVKSSIRYAREVLGIGRT